MKTFRSLESCPNCGAIWGIGSEEWDWQQCDACGWPDNEEDYNEFDWEEEEDDYDQWCEDNNPNDSRNI